MSSTDNAPRDDVRAFLDFMNSQPKPEGPPDVAVSRQAYRVLKQMTNPDPVKLAVVRDLACPGPAGDIPVRFYDSRESRDPGPVVLFFHGGGYVIGDLETHNSLCNELAARLDLPVLAVDYRCAPEHPFPAPVDDCEAAARWLATNPAELDREVTGIVTFGVSAGANAALVIARSLADNPAELPILLQVLGYPWVDDLVGGSMEEFAEKHLLTRDTMEWFSSCYQPEAGNPRAYPALATVDGLPPTVIATAGLDPLRDQGRSYAAKLVDAGIDVCFFDMKGLIHDFMTLRKTLPSAQTETLKVISAMKMMLGLA